MKEIILSVLVFTAAGSLAFAVFHMFRTFRLEKAEEDVFFSDEKGVQNRKKTKISQQFLQMQLTASVIMFGLTAGLLLLCGIVNVFIWGSLSLVSGGAGYFFPYLQVRWRNYQRKQAFENRMLDLSMGLVSGLKAGQALPQALDAVTRRIGEPMQTELLQVLREYRLGLSLPEALERLHERMPGEDLKILVTSVKLTIQSGGSLADVIDRMVDMIRKRVEFQTKLRTLTAQGKFEAIAIALSPVAAFILLFIIDRPLMEPILNTPIGYMAPGIALLLDITGFAIIYKIVNIEV